MPHCGRRIRKKFPRRPWCPEIFKPPLTCAVVRERARMFALTLLVAQSTLVLPSFVRIGGPREIQSTRENWRTTVTCQSIRSESRGTITMPFAQRFTCTIDDACEVTGLGRTKLYELIGAGRIVTTTIGRRRLVVVRSLLALLDTNMSN
ncbi:helix-turn-helix domain-containing protein [Bradyrhizobium lablabi]|uniref:helix-turn-helix domain-containing protein n=2 Tax=Nitrobacteraceae TaxID=41294 RepID=UPI003D9BA3A5